jgi:hypothetical protein
MAGTASCIAASVKGFSKFGERNPRKPALAAFPQPHGLNMKLITQNGLPNHGDVSERDFIL